MNNIDMKKNLVSITELRDTERRVLNYMLLSKDNFIEICDRLDKNYFILYTHRVMFEYATTVFKRLLLFTMDNSANEMQQVLEDYSKAVAMAHNFRTIERYLRFNYKITATEVLKELSKVPSNDITSDIAIIKAYANESAIAKSTGKNEVNIDIITNDVTTLLSYIDDRLIGVISKNLNDIPTETCSRFNDTMEMIYELDTKSGSNKLRIRFDDDKQEQIHSVLLSKGIIVSSEKIQ